MIGLLLVTHGRLAEELRSAVLTIQPGLDRIVAVALEWSETGEDAREKIRRGLAQADEGDPSCDWVHAYLHRKEGDLGNAGYWYHRAGKPECRAALVEEWADIASALLES